MSKSYIPKPTKPVNTKYQPGGNPLNRTYTSDTPRTPAVNPPVSSPTPQKRRTQKPKPINLDNEGLTYRKHELIKLHKAVNQGSQHSSMRCSSAGLDHYVGTTRHNLTIVDIYSNGSAKFAGVKLCKSPNACPKCSQIIGVQRAIQIGRWAEEEQRRGRILVLLTLTLQHQLADMLEDLLKQLNLGINATKKAFQVFLQNTQYCQQIESPFNKRTGWHPHIHMLLSLPPGIDVEEWMANIIEHWIRWQKKKGYYASRQAQDFEIINNPKGAGQYITKVFKAGFEITNSSAKTDSESFSYHELLILSKDDPYYAAKAKEYFETIQGRQLFRKSQGLDLAQYDEDEDEDEDDKPKKIASLKIIAPPQQSFLDLLIVIEQIKFNPAQAPPDHKAKIEAAFRKHKIKATVSVRQEEI